MADAQKEVGRCGRGGEGARRTGMRRSGGGHGVERRGNEERRGAGFGREGRGEGSGERAPAERGWAGWGGGQARRVVAER